MSHRGIHVLAAIAALICFAVSPVSAQDNSPDPRPQRVASVDATGNDSKPSPSNGITHRMALVIGNATYQSVTPLRNPANDTKVVTELLSGAGFEVVSAADLSQAEMRAVVDDFAAKIREKGPDTVALVYYAGHGLQVDGENFLVPVDASVTSAADVATQAVRLADVMKVLESAPSRVRIVILDACRNNPFDVLGDAGGRGLAIVDAPTGSIVAYSTAPGTEALDGKGAHSPYAAAFKKTIKQPGLPIEQFFKRVRRLVHESTDGKQTPWESSSLTGDFAFFPGLTPDIANAQARADESETEPKPEPRPVKTAQLADLRTRSVSEAYDVVIEEDRVEYYEEFVRLYPQDPLCDRIRQLLARRLQMVAWYDAVRINTPFAYSNYVRRFGTSDFAFAARRLQVRPRVVPVALLTNFSNGRRPTVMPAFRLGGARPILPTNRIRTVAPRFGRGGLTPRINDRIRVLKPRPVFNNGDTTLPPKRTFKDRVKTFTPGRSFRDRVKVLPPRGTVQDRVKTTTPGRSFRDRVKTLPPRGNARDRFAGTRRDDFGRSDRRIRSGSFRSRDFREPNNRQRDFRRDRFTGNRNSGFERNRPSPRFEPRNRFNENRFGGNRFNGNRNAGFNRSGNAQRFSRPPQRFQGAAPRQRVQRFGFQNRPF